MERQLVVEQLRSGGVIEALQVQRAGFPCRCTVSSFLGGGLVAERWMDHSPKVKLKKWYTVHTQISIIFFMIYRI